MKPKKLRMLILLYFVTAFFTIASTGCCQKTPSDNKADFLVSVVWNTNLLGLQYFPEVDDTIYKVPWLSDRKSFGIAFSGGGTRSASATLGQLRALHELGWLDEAKYISAISGGAWAAVPYTYYPEKDDGALLGRYVAPKDLKKPDIESTVKGSLAETIDKSSVGIKAINGLVGLKKDETYSSVIGKIFLKPYDLHQRPYFAFHDESVDSILKNNPVSGLTSEDFYTVKKGRPYLIVGGTFISKDANDSSSYYPLEMSGLYVGIRIKQDAQTKRGIEQIGGGYIQPHVYDTDTPLEFDNERVKSPLGSKRKNFTLSDVVGISGAAPQHTLRELKIKNIGFPEHEYWSIDQNSEVHEYPHGDGGHLDNLGLMSLLVRQVKNIIVFANSDRALGEKDKLDLKSYFAEIAPKGLFPGYQKNKVFDKYKYDELVSALKNKIGNEPLVHCDEYRVEENIHYGIKPYNAKICWVYLDRNEQWVDQVAKSSIGEKQINRLKGKKRSYARFPHYKTFLENPPYVINLSRYQVNALAHLTSWTLCKSKNTIANALNADGLELPTEKLRCESCE